MKREGVFLFANLFSAKGNVEAIESTKDVEINGGSQVHVLRQRMEESNMTHAETVVADIAPVRLQQEFGQTVMYFCPMGPISVKEKLTPGDGGALPPTAILEGLKAPANLKSGIYTLKNIKISSNGTLQVIATPETVFESVEEFPF